MCSVLASRATRPSTLDLDSVIEHYEMTQACPGKGRQRAIGLTFFGDLAIREVQAESSFW